MSHDINDSFERELDKRINYKARITELVFEWRLEEATSLAGLMHARLSVGSFDSATLILNNWLERERYKGAEWVEILCSTQDFHETVALEVLGRSHAKRLHFCYTASMIRSRRDSALISVPSLVS